MSSVTPADSASAQGKKKNRPGKNARNAARSAAPQSEPARTAASSMSNASFFASQAARDPVPQPGRFPVVFQAMAGMPTSDTKFSYQPGKIADILENLDGRYVYNPRYAEFSNHSGYDDDSFRRDLARIFLLALAQRTVYSHVNMGLTMGDLSSLASSDAFIFPSLKTVVDQFGEFSSPALGTRYVLGDYATTIHSIVRMASHVRANDSWISVIRRGWIPSRVGDPRTAFLVACRLAVFVRGAINVSLDVDTLSGKVFREEWDVFEAIKPLLGLDDDGGSRFDRLFTGYANEQMFADKFTPDEGQDVLDELGLNWAHPAVTHFDFGMVPKVRFPELLDQILAKKPAFSKFFNIVSNQHDKLEAAGSITQVSEVTSNSGVTVVRTHVSVTAQDESLLACFPPTGAFAEVGPLHVVETTAVAVSLRATEFLQLDWVN
jgi:hypothetical protein